MEIRPLRRSDDRSAFASGDPDLDGFFRRYAGQNQFRHHVGVTHVAVDDDRILGYATVAPGNVEIDEIPAKLRLRLPTYPLPVLRLGRLAVDASARGRGIGSALLRFVLALSLRLGSEYGCVGVVVDAKPGAVAFYERLGFFLLDVLEGAADARPAPTAMFLPRGEIQAALRGG